MRSTTAVAAPSRARVAPADAMMALMSSEEKDDGDELQNVDELDRAYIPLALARQKLSALTSELAAMKSRHLTLMDSISARYEALQTASRQHFEGVVDEVKARASLRLKENK